MLGREVEGMQQLVLIATRKTTTDENKGRWGKQRQMRTKSGDGETLTQMHMSEGGKRVWWRGGVGEGSRGHVVRFQGGCLSMG